MKRPIVLAGLVLAGIIAGALFYLAFFAIPAASSSAGSGPPPASAPAQIVKDGSFEVPAATKEYDTFTPGTKLGAWTIGGGPVDVVGKYWKPASGAQSLNLRGGEVRPWIWQDVKTEPGTMYTLKFALSGNPDNAPRDKKIEIWWDDQLIDTVVFGVENVDHLHMGWKYITYNITAQKPTSKLRFASGVDSPWGPAIDDVTMTEAGK